jgi:hypothetical protein
MGLFDSQTKELNAAIIALKGEIAELKAEREATNKELGLSKDVVKLKTQITDLEIQKAKIVEENAREKRDVTHMVGLERRRQEFEAEQARQGIEQARKEAVLEVKAENLKVEREAFKKEMDFREARFVQEVGYLKDLMGQVLDRLPTVSVDRHITEKTTTAK